MGTASAISLAVGIAALSYFVTSLGCDGSHVFTFICGLLALPTIELVLGLRRNKSLEGQSEGTENLIYGLEHARLHVRWPLPMWMNMGYWRTNEHDGKNQTDYSTETTNQCSLATASRALLSEVLATAGFSREDASKPSNHPTRALLDLGFGCGDQTIYLMSEAPLRRTDEEWWDARSRVPRLASYVGITLNRKQYQCAQNRLQELEHSAQTRLFCADAASPGKWDSELRQHLTCAFRDVDERWVLALDTLYHFAPSRWGIVDYAAQHLRASLLAFDLCLADDISMLNRMLLRIVTGLMGAPWVNFVTKEQYRDRLRQAGYADVVMRDVSEDVFAPLARFMEEQDRVLGAVGFQLGKFQVARWMFAWWGRSGIVRGVIFVARGK